jgi:hypothetical protein
MTRTEVVYGLTRKRRQRPPRMECLWRKRPDLTATLVFMVRRAFQASRWRLPVETCTRRLRPQPPLTSRHTVSVIQLSSGPVSRPSASRLARSSSLAARLAISCLSLIAVLGAIPAFAARARAARTVNLSESARLHRTSSNGVHLNEQGSATGTIHGTIYIHLRVSSNRVSAEVSIYPHGGSLTGYGSASYHVNGGFAPFSGTLTISRGSGTYAHAHSGALRFTGTIQRSNDAVTVQLSGRLSY